MGSTTKRQVFPVTAIAVAVLVGGVAIQPALADNDEWIWCQAKSRDSASSDITVYYSGVFLGDYSRDTRYENAFHDFLEARYESISRGKTYCFFENDRSGARAERDDRAADYREGDLPSWLRPCPPVGPWCRLYGLTILAGERVLKISWDYVLKLPETESLNCPTSIGHTPRTSRASVRGFPGFLSPPGVAAESHRNRRRNVMYRKALCAVLFLAAIGVAAPAAAQDRYGSIVFSQHANGSYAWGMAWSFDSPSSARSRAMQECWNRGGSNCGEIGWFRNACGSLAIGDNNGYGVGWGDSSSRAANEALSTCRQYNRNCRSAITRCAN